jgi:hypothetical protein
MPQRKSKLMRKHTNLSAMVRLMGNHVAHHLHTNRPRLSPTIPPKYLNPPTLPKRLSKHLPTSSRTLRQPHPHLLRRAVRPIEQHRNLQMRSRKPHPLAANIVHMRKDRSNAANVTGRFRPPRTRVKMLNKTLVHPIISSKHPNCCWSNLSVNLMSTSSHGSCSSTHSTSRRSSHRSRRRTLLWNSKPLTPKL